ncbi:hypothetical protein KC573_00520 [candidate division WWE3 bacterium]|uniref:PKD domain-containing protein n=1 Tax=candidate division WWE3 bacterium TaxID=2053526 RepID=A0A955LW37_UNCKA|nr:hypothetical protein [candidate division WWE3 bacterium]
MKNTMKPYTFGVIFVSILVIFLSSATAYWITINDFFQRKDGNEDLPNYERTINDLTCKMFPGKREYQVGQTISIGLSLTGLSQENTDSPGGLENISVADLIMIDWGDGTINTYSSIKEPIIHAYQSPGTYQAIGKVTYRHTLTNETATATCTPYTHTRFQIE